jgi:GT2 family glycosyltransferase
MRKPVVSIIILNFNGLKDTIECLKSLEKTTYRKFEVIVVDNGSEKNEADIIRKRFKHFIKVYRLEKNLGFTGGNNWALEKTRGKYIVLLNNDTIVEPKWLEPLVSLLEKDRKIAVIQPKIKMMQKKNHFDYAGAAGGYIDKYGFPFTRGRIFNTQEKDTGQYDGQWPIFWASGAACIIRKSIINKVGGLFSRDLFNYMEEIDFCWRVWRTGYKVIFTSDSVVYHKVAATAGKNFVQKRFWEHRNNLYILIRNLEKKSLVRILPIRLLLEIITYAYYIISRQRKYVLPLLHAHLDFITNGFYIRLNKNHKIANGKAPIYPGSVIFDHYIKKKKTFKSLNWSAKGNIAYLIFNTTQNTGSEVVFKQANKFIEKGYCVSIYSIFGNKQNWFKLKANFDNFIFSFQRPKPDVLIATFWPTSYLSLIMRAKNKLFFSQDWGPSMHSLPVFKHLAKFAYKLPITKIVHSNFLKDKIKNKDSQVKKIQYSVLGGEFKKNFNRKRRYKYKKQGGIRILSVISWYTHCKGPDILLKIIKNLKKQNGKYHFTLISREKKPPSTIIDKFISNPSKAIIASLYKESDILLATSRTEGMPVPGLEAMASGCLFITTQSGGVTEYAKNNYNSIILSNPGEIWNNNFLENLLKDEKKVNRLITNGYKTASNYWEDKMIDDLETILFMQGNKI